jgi:hypothetical protein
MRALTVRWLGLSAVLALVCTLTARADDKKPRYPKPPSDKGVKIVPEAWKSAPNKALTPAELDRLLTAAQKKDNIKPAPVVSDEVYIRRVYLDLTGAAPGAADIKRFSADTHSDKRAKLVDKLLDSRAFARSRARHWRDVMLSRATEDQGFVKRPRETSLEGWLNDQFKEKEVNWGKIATALITATGEDHLNLREPSSGGVSALLLAHTRQNGPVERTNDTARIFLGINLQCAQCHDHPDDIWKRTHFHEMAAFYGRLGDRIKFTREPINFETMLVSRGFGEYRMPEVENPRRGTTMQPRFLTGEKPGERLTDRARRRALAKYVTDKDNYYFSAAFVNRVWGDLMGQAFVMPVDNLGPLQPAMYSDVLIRLADSFRASDYDVKALYRLITTSTAYQRQMRYGDSAQEHVRFAGTYPTRLRPDALYDALTKALGPLQEAGGFGGRGGFGGGPFGRGQLGLRGSIKSLFDFDPSAKPEDVEGSVPQALLMMNNETLNRQIKATGNTVLAKVLKDFSKDGDAVDQVYLRALSRSPTVNEKKVCLEHVGTSKSRGAAFEDILWSLINSAEFRTKR